MGFTRRSAEISQRPPRRSSNGIKRKIEDEEYEHIYHSKGWCRELWIASLGLEAVLPPPEEQKDVKTAIGAARAEKFREDML